MSIRNLKHLFRPGSVAVIGATARPMAVGAVVMRNLLQGGFSGPIMPVNPKRDSVAGVLAYPDVASLPMTPDLAVICTPAPTVPAILDSLGQRGTKAAAVLAGGMGPQGGENGEVLLAAMMEVARRYGMRLLGPNCLGLMVPGIGLNASFAHQGAMPGKIAFVSQSGALCTAVLDWAKPKGIGFSHFISLGDAVDLDFGDVLDYLGSDPSTRAILLYIESIHERRNFMSAARAAARNKPVLAIKAGRVAESARAAAFHTGALAGSDAVYDAAISRAGILRVRDIDELFDAVETLARSRPLKGERLAILTNGGGIGVMATDDLIDQGGQLAELTPETIAKLEAVLPCGRWSGGNPVDILPDAPGSRYADALQVLLDAPEVDSVLCMHAPTAIASSTEVAQAIVDLLRSKRQANVSTCWIGAAEVAAARRLFAEAGIPSYETPGSAVRAFLHLVRYRRNQELLMETPASAPSEFTPATVAARLVVEHALAAGQDVLSDPEAKAILAAYGIPTVETHVARTPADAGRMAKAMDRPVALKILSPDLPHKSDVGGVMLNLQGAFEVEKAAHAMLDRVARLFPEAHITGFSVQEMARRPGAQELVAGFVTDPVFGPVVLFGEGGTAVEVIDDSAVGLPPLNMNLAREMITRTRIHRRLQGFGDRAGADMDAISLALMQVAQIATDIPEIVSLHINPLFADAKGVLALDARIHIAPAIGKAADRLAIRPYPKELEEQIQLPDGSRVLIRPIRPEDEPNHHVFVSKLTPEDIRFRFFGLVHELPHSEMARLTQIDYDREMAFIAETIEPGKIPETVAVVRTVTDPDNERSEFAIVVRSDIKAQGLGRKMLAKMIDYCRSRGTQTMVGQVLLDNTRMLRLVESLGFQRGRHVERDVVEVALSLNPASRAA
ncbi:bifunctional acetate--CoA ligase family protein/GNAT family N-acetyltransferase [Telmatospirillum sp. J64-1]|uniref:bifunctional acetate--CoA ligase family protein/GNAT family N-acetyltransferase n=1 Tax=Telmatospirillum sp. J64-1 TaxID=2502183 RepID=UPI00115E52B7|nr:bifunctional acetate--CoA ligase family protein/GNAT family N-acetyltransferase [Telmatospirillum sp. J64-1]